MAGELKLPKELPEKYEQTGPDGLTESEAAARKEAGRSNRMPRDDGKTNTQIILENVFTLFNLLNLGLAACLIAVGSYRNMLFLLIVVLNTGIAVFQEIRARNTIRKLKLVNAPKAHVIREGKERVIAPEDAVEGDLLVLRAGDQVVADGIVTEGYGRAMESLLTGESDPIPKEDGNWVYSGSYLTEGRVICQLVYVGAESYAGRLTKDAKTQKNAESGLMRDLKRLIKWDSIALLPMGLLLFLKQTYWQKIPLDTAVPTAVAAMLGMIPEGLMLLTSVAMAVGVIRLARKQVLVQELYGIESLARVDTLCLDKTGTLTSGRMQLDEMIPLEASAEEARESVRRYLGAFDGPSATLDALRAEYPPMTEVPSVVLPFSSQRKKSAASFGDGRTIVLGAPEYVMGDRYAAETRSMAEERTARGRRVLILAEGEGLIEHGELPEIARPIALLSLTDEIRPHAAETVRYLQEQDVRLKVISGDDPATVSRIAAEAGIENGDRAVDARTLRTEDEIREACREYTVFGRVTPEQKKQIVGALQADGHTVGMTGDGVNDIPALRAADCSIAMAQGADAARNAAQMTLLESDFSAVPDIVLEGRRVINNITRSATLFLVKTIFSFLLCLLTMILPGRYPFQPIQLSLVSACTIGFPGLFLSLEPSDERIKGNFLRNVLLKALPGGVAVAVSASVAMSLSRFGMDPAVCSTLATGLAGMIGVVSLARACVPMSPLRLAVTILSAGSFALISVCFAPVFFLVTLHGMQWLALAALGALAAAVYVGTIRIESAAEKKHAERAAAKA